MLRRLSFTAAFLIGGALLCLADPPKAGTTARTDDSIDVLEAQLDTKKAFVKAAEVALTGAKAKLKRVEKSGDDTDQAKLDVETAAAQLDIRKAEAREIEVRIKQEKVRPPESVAKVGAKVAVFNMAAVMRDYEKAKYRVYVLNKLRVDKSEKLMTLRAKYIKLQQEVPTIADPEAKEAATKEMLDTQRKYEDEERKINKVLNDEASRIIATLYDEIKKVVDKTAELNTYHIVLAYPDAVTPEEQNNPYLKELKLKPPAAQPFFVAKQADITNIVVDTLNKWYPPLDEKGEKVDVSKLPSLPAPTTAPAPK